MKPTVRTVAVSVVLSAAAALLSACGSGASGAAGNCTPESQFKTMRDKTLTIVGPDYPPLFMYQSNLDGVDGKIIESFASANCLTTDVRVLPAAGVIESVKGGQADLGAGGWYPTAERAKVVNLTDPIYGDPVVLVGKNPSTKIEDYAGKKIGTTQGYNWVDDLVKFAGDNAKLYQSPDAVYQDLVSGRIDVALMAVNEAAYRLKSGSELSYVKAVPTPIIKATQNAAVTSFPTTKGNDELTAALNNHISKLRDSGKLAEILKEFNIDASAATPAKG
ncbi:ABC transporter substrate-binding protein [Arthrobacter sp. M4]|uniref:substrate-binding periplasmic protein n=1 Tax=Arthrobacter sp. M4 TaxID=218160 RepID=UPI001CDD1881|nr:transporter substrate-binding domain-containing protein [Arthrobacter sp. M4]MCA4134809.1 transporter substrate-binding domain-containing protein [Arthrobacter sp. M4]